jgi:hypothetical protein
MEMGNTKQARILSQFTLMKRKSPAISIFEVLPSNSENVELHVCRLSWFPVRRKRPGCAAYDSIRQGGVIEAGSMRSITKGDLFALIKVLTLSMTSRTDQPAAFSEPLNSRLTPVPEQVMIPKEPADSEIAELFPNKILF